MGVFSPCPVLLGAVPLCFSAIAVWAELGPVWGLGCLVSLRAGPCTAFGHPPTLGVGGGRRVVTCARSLRPVSFPSGLAAPSLAADVLSELTQLLRVTDASGVSFPPSVSSAGPRDPLPACPVLCMIGDTQGPGL